MSTVTRGQLIRDDVALYDGVTRTSSRTDATGGTVTGLNFGEAIDILQVFGSGTSRSVQTINDAIARLGGANGAFQFTTGTWTIDSNVTIPSTIACYIPAGCTFSISSGVTLTFNGPIYSDLSSFSSGSGTLTYGSGGGSIAGLPLIVQTAAESTAGVTPTNYKRSPERAYDIRRFGAAGDDSTDNASAIETAISVALDQGANHTESGQIGIQIYVPPGIFRVDSTVDVDSDGIQFIGEGRHSVIKTTGDFPAFTVKGGVLQKIWGVEFDHLRFTSTVTDRGAGSAAIKYDSAQEWKVRNCIFHLQTQYAIWLLNTISGDIIGNYFHTGDWNNKGMAYGIYSEVDDAAGLDTGPNAVRVMNNIFSRIGTAGIALLGEPVAGATTPIRREAAGLVVHHNHFEHNYGDDVQFLRCRGSFGYNWHEDGGLDAASGNAYYHDLASDDNEGSGGSENSGNNMVDIHHNTFGGHDNSHDDFAFVELNFSVNSRIRDNHLTEGKSSVGAPIINLGGDHAAANDGLLIENNWCNIAVEPTLSGSLPTIHTIRNNWKGPTSGAGRNRWTGTFADTNQEMNGVLSITGTGDTTPSILSTTMGRVRTVILAPTGALTITDFDDAREGDELTLVFANGNCTIQNTSGDNGINLTAGSNFTGTAKDTMRLIYVNSNGFTGRWFELGQEII